jgi:hypothetical protein
VLWCCEDKIGCCGVVMKIFLVSWRRKIRTKIFLCCVPALQGVARTSATTPALRVSIF